ncbi:MAG: amino acid ABC transporter permease [Actinomycetota bacterium]|nr:amino acid ABC transporter permease [Actinomycetota bacterium]
MGGSPTPTPVTVRDRPARAALSEQAAEPLSPADGAERADAQRERRLPKRSDLPRLVRKPARWTLLAVVLVLLAMLGHLLVTSSSLQWGVVGHWFVNGGILAGLLRTLYLTALAMTIGIVGGTILALMRLSKSAVLSLAATVYIWFFRGTPLLVQILFWYNIAAFVPRLSIGVPFGPTFVSGSTNALVTTLVAATLGLGLNEAAYMSEIVRAGIVSVDTRQTEAATALGMTRTLAFRRIVFPQAMRFIIPPTGNQAISMLKGTSLVSVISLPELLYSVQLVYARTFQTIPLLVVACLWYLIVTTVLSVGQHFVERHFGRSESSRRSTNLLDRIRARQFDQFLS